MAVHKREEIKREMTDGLGSNACILKLELEPKTCCICEAELREIAQRATATPTSRNPNFMCFLCPMDLNKQLTPNGCPLADRVLTFHYYWAPRPDSNSFLCAQLRLVAISNVETTTSI